MAVLHSTHMNVNLKHTNIPIIKIQQMKKKHKYSWLLVSIALINTN